MKSNHFHASVANEVGSDCGDNFSLFLEAVSTGEYRPSMEASAQKLKNGSG